MRKEVKDMAHLILSLAVLGFITIGAILCAIEDRIEYVRSMRRESRFRFLQSHPGYGIDESGKIVKL